MHIFREVEGHLTFSEKNVKIISKLINNDKNITLEKDKNGNTWYSKTNDVIKLKIDFCLFMQDNYIEGTKENCILELTFNGASTNIENIEDNTIIDTKIDEKKIVFNLNIDKNNDYIQLEIQASSVELFIN